MTSPPPRPRPKEYRRDLPTVERAFEFEPQQRDAPAGIEPGYFMSGYASVFNAPASITEFGREFTERISPGAFKRTLSTNAPPVVLWEHGHGHMGNLPIARLITAREDGHGLYVEAEMFKNDQVEAIREAIEGQAVRTMSFKMQVLQDSWNRQKTERDIKEIRLFEVSAVTFAAYPQTSVGVRHEEGQSTMRSTTRDERMRMVRQLQVDGLRRVKRTTKPERQLQVAELLADRTGGIVVRKGMSRAERMALVAFYKAKSDELQARAGGYSGQRSDYDSRSPRRAVPRPWGEWR